MPSSWLESCSISSMVMRNCSPDLFSTTQIACGSPSASASVSWQGGLIQFSGL